MSGIRDQFVMRIPDFSAFRRDVRHIGILPASVRALYYRLHALMGLRVYSFLVLEPATVNHELLTRQVNYQSRLLSVDEIRELARDPDNQFSDTVVARATELGDVAYALFDGKELASFGWYACTPISVMGTTQTVFSPRYWYMYHGYTKPKYRGKNLHGIGLARACRDLCAGGAAGIVTLVETANFASSKSARRSGYRDFGQAVVLPLGDRPMIWQNSSRPDLELRLMRRTGALKGSGSS